MTDHPEPFPAALRHGDDGWGSPGGPGGGPGGSYPPVARTTPPMEPRTAVVLVSGFFAVLLSALMILLPVPFIVLKPGPVLNTLGSSDGKPLISVTGHSTYPAKGELDLTTVSEIGGSGPVSLITVLRSWISQHDAVLPRNDVIPKGQTAEQTDEQNKLQMASSQESATAAALGTLDIPVPTKLTIAGVDPTAPAAKTLKAGDVITKIGGVAVPDLKSLSDELQKVQPGDPVTVTVVRSGKTLNLTTGTGLGNSGQTILRIYISPAFRFPFQVKIQIENIGGPSAGTMFALGIIDVLTPGDLTGGKHIAGTGTIDATGTVGPIGGIQQKMVGARDSGADYFLAPVDNCNEVSGHIPDGLSVVKIATLDDAQASVKAIAAGQTASLPHC